MEFRFLAWLNLYIRPSYLAIKDLPAVLVLSCRVADAGNYNSRSVQDFVRSVLNAVMSLQSNAETADRSRETTNSDRLTSVESEINSRFQIPRRWAAEALPSTATRIVPPSDFNPRQNCSSVQTSGRRYPGGKHDSRCFLM